MRRAAAVMGLIGGALIAGAAPAASSAVAASPGSSARLARYPSAAAELLDSPTPKTVVLDPSTGTVVSVTLGGPTPAISSGTTCEAGDGCYYTPTVDGTYHDRSFYGGPGTFTGSWPRRNAWDTGSYTAYACWDSACSQSFGPNTYLTFGGALVTGTSFTIE